MMIDAVARCARGCARLGALAIVVVIGLVMVPAGHAAEPLVILNSTPANGAVIAQTSSQALAAPIPVSITTSGIPTSGAMTMFLEVSTQNVPGVDGTLADDFVVNSLVMTRSDAYPAVYTGSLNYYLYKVPWASVPGTYYWQVNTSYFDPLTGSHTLQSPVFTIVVAAPALVPVSPPVVTPVVDAPVPDYASAPTRPYRMTLVDVGYDVPLVISKHDLAAGSPKRLCKRVSRVSFKCAVTWKDRLFEYAGTLRVTDKGNGQPRSTFVGGRARLSCIRALVVTTPKHTGAGQVSLQACVKPWRW